MFKIARRTISSIASQIDDDGKEDLRDQPSDAELSPEAIEDRERKELEDQIVDKWATVWFGLYQIRNRHGPYHIDQLRKLYAGAGMAGYLAKRELDQERTPSPLGLLGIALSTSSRQYYNSDGTSNGIHDLRLFDNLSLSTLRLILDLLADYESIIEQFQEVLALLRSLQVDTTRTPSPVDEEEVLRRYPPVADPVAERILHYNSRLSVLVMDMESEAMEKYEQLQPREDEFGVSPKRNPPVGWYVRDRVFPRGRKTGIFSGSSIV